MSVTEASLSAANLIKKVSVKSDYCELQKSFLQKTIFVESGCFSSYTRSEFLKRNKFDKNFRLLTDNQSIQLDLDMCLGL